MSILKDEYRVNVQQAPPGSVRVNAPSPTPSQGKLQTNLPKKTQDGSPGFLQSLADSFLGFPKLLAGAGYEAYRAGKYALGDKTAYGNEKTGKTKENPFLNEKEIVKLSTPKSAAIEGGKKYLGTASFLLPGGGGGNILKTAGLTATAGLMQGLSEENATPQSVATNTAAGAVLGPAFHFAGKGVSKLLSPIATKLFPKVVEGSTGAATKAAREVTDTALADIPEEINYAIYKRIPKRIKDALGINTRVIRNALKTGGTIDAPVATKLNSEQLRFINSMGQVINTPPAVVEKTSVVSKETAQTIRNLVKESINRSDTPEEARTMIARISDMAINNSPDSPTYIKKLKVLRAELNRQMYELVGANTGDYKRDYAYLQTLKDDPITGQIVSEIEDKIVQIDDIVKNGGKTMPKIPAAVAEKVPEVVPDGLPSPQRKVINIAEGKFKTPESLKAYMQQIQKGSVGASKTFTKFSLRPELTDAAVEAPATGVKGFVNKIKTGIDEFSKNFLTQTSKVIEDQGSYGKVLAKHMRDVRDVAERRSGQTIYQIGQTLKTMSPEDSDALVNFLDQGTPPANPVVQEAGLKIRSLLDSVAQEAKDLGLEQTELKGMGMTKNGFTKLENYFPHIFTDTEKFAQKDVREKILQRLVSSGKAADRADAIEMLDKFIKKTAPRRFGSLEFGRFADIEGWERDPLKALSTYFDRAFRRLEEVKRFGPNNERVFGGVIKGKEIKGLVQRIGEEGGDTQFVESAFKRVHGTEVPTLTTQGFKDAVSKNIGSVQVLTKLGLGQITNLGQTFNTVVKFGLGPTWKALKEAVRKGTKEESQAFALRSGATLDAVIRDVTEGQGGGNLATKFLKKTGFQASENMNRIIASNAGKNAAKAEFEKILAGKGSEPAERMLTEMGINLKQAINRGSLNEQELLKAGQKAAEWTQFRVGAIDVPYFWSTPEGRIVTQFKNFAYKHAQFIKDSVIKEAVTYHNYKPLTRLILFSQLIGEPLSDIKQLVRGKDFTRKDIDSIPERMWDNFASLGSFGLFWDLWQSATYGRTAEFFTGPTVGDAATLVEKGAQAIKGDVKPLAKEVVRRVPVAGPLLKSFIPAENKKKSSPRLAPLPAIR